MDRLVKISIVLAVLMAGFGVFYHYVIYVPGVEADKRVRQDLERQEQKAQQEAQRRETEAREVRRKFVYESCLANARTNYEGDWAAACLDVARTRHSNLNNCLADRAIVSNPYMGVQYCRTTYGGADASPNCSLPKPRAESIDNHFKQAQDRCLNEAKTGL